MIPIATFRKDDRVDGPLLWLLWEPRSGVVWTRRNFGEPPRSWPTFYFAKRRFAVDAMVADVWGGRYPQTFKPIPRRDDLHHDAGDPRAGIDGTRRRV